MAQNMKLDIDNMQWIAELTLIFNNIEFAGLGQWSKI